jgi:hypothetical protein
MYTSFEDETTNDIFAFLTTTPHPIPCAHTYLSAIWIAASRPFPAVFNES